MKPTMVALLTALPLAACDDVPTEIPHSTVRVTVATVGGDVDDRYELAVGADKRTIGSFGFVAIDGLSGGPITVELTGVADNCSVAGENPRVIDVEQGLDASTQFDVSCDATGLEIEVKTETGESLLNYTVRTSSATKLVQPNGIVAVTRLTPGSHVVYIDTPANCSVIGTHPLAAEVINRKVTRLSVAVSCERLSDLIAFTYDSLTVNWYTRWVGVTNASGSSPTALFAGYDPVWTPAGDKLVWSTTGCDYYYSSGCHGGLSVFDLKTRVVTQPSSGSAGADAAFSADGKSIAFVWMANDLSTHLRVGSFDGLATVLSLPAGPVGGPTWSPDGRRIAFACRFDRADMDICAVNKDGTGYTRLLNAPGTEYDPAWSPDGQSIALSVNSGNQSSVATMNADGSGLRILTPGFDPDWSPDGSKIVFARADGLFVMNADGSAETRITTGRHHDPKWRR